MSTKKRDELLDIQATVQKVWADTKAFEIDAPAGEGKARAEETYMVTFPYPYMNGKLHLGHAFTITKAEFAAGYQRLRGKKCLFPFGFHCTGMPIKASADKIKRELEVYGNPPVFPEAAADAGSEKKTHAKIAAKSGGETFQWNIMKHLGIPESEIPQFAEAETWLKYFPPKGMEHLAMFGCKIDWRRSFITTPVNPFYDSFVRWQFEHLKEKNKIKFGKRYTIYSPKDGQPCMDHDRSKGEGVAPQEYTLIKLEVLDPKPKSLQGLGDDKKIFLVAATLRPETMYGQTNCWVSPTIPYVAVAISDTEVFVCTQRAARNISYQPFQADSGLGVHGNTKPEGVSDVVANVPGADLLGCKLKAPYAEYPEVYALPLLTIKENKGTGIVTSVPSDAPDDFAGLRDLKKKKAFREKYGITDEMVLPFDPVPIIDIPGYSTMSAEKACDDLKVASQNDAVKLAEAKDLCYQKGFSEGIMMKGTFAGTPVKAVKDKVRDEMLEKGLAALYREPENMVVSRSDDQCVVALCDQWFLTYGEDEWRKEVADYVNGPFECFDPMTKKRFNETLDWLHEHACSRQYGLGSRLPWDEEWLIESLSDSTIYMAYYTVAHLLQGGSLDGSAGSPLGITVEQLTRQVWDHIFLGTPVSEDCPVSADKLATLRNEFLYFYPMDLRVSGKDLVPNHLTYSLYNHAAIFPPDMWPRAFRANGHLMLNHDKMSKSTGNFLTLEDSIGKYTADITRLACADAGDSLEDANFEEKAADAQLVKMHAELEWITSTLADLPTLRSGPVTEFADKAFKTCIDYAVHEAADAYDRMNFRDALKVAFFELQGARDDYREMMKLTGEGMHRDVIMHYIEVQYLLIAPICPHICEHVWKLLGKEGTMMTNGRWPEAGEVDVPLHKAFVYVGKMAHTFRLRINAAKNKKSKGKGGKGGKGKKGGGGGGGGDAPAAAPPTEIAKVVVYVASEYPEWQRVVLAKLDELFDPTIGTKGTFADNRTVLGELKGNATLKSVMKKVMPFVQFVRDQVEIQGRDALSQVLPFDELEVMKTNAEYLKQTLELETIEVLPVSETDNAKILDDCVPGNPYTLFV
eukprot:m.40180 g.40180  ORF g.40180 m.40180 type:complete len:1085 (-) comp5929_c0_seq1:1678-4932(-)